MNKKPFYAFPMFHIKVKRHRWNPIRFLLGDYYLVPNTSKEFIKHIDLDTKDITFNKENN
jgi:hypothetical protein